MSQLKTLDKDIEQGNKLLLSCPHCGNLVTIKQEPTGPFDCYFVVRCDCGASMLKDTIGELIDAWNKRS